MFGYIGINQGEMKIKDYEIYHSYYCGLCRSLKETGGIKGQLTLSYDMTFLVMTLTALYEPETTKKSLPVSGASLKEASGTKKYFLGLQCGYESDFVLL